MKARVIVMHDFLSSHVAGGACRSERPAHVFARGARGLATLGKSRIDACLEDAAPGGPQGSGTLGEAQCHADA